MSITKQDINSFIKDITKIPLINNWERRDFIKSLKYEVDEMLCYSYKLNTYHIEYCYGVLYAKDRKEIEKNNDINLFKYLSKLMLYTLNGETDNSWLEDKYKEYHDKYDFSKDKIFTLGTKKEKELTYDDEDGEVDWCPDDDFIEEITKQTKGYNKNKQLFAHTVWRMVSFIQNENTDISLYKEIVKTLCLEIYDEPSTVDINDIIIEIKNTFQIGDVGFTYDFETWVDSILDKEDLVDYLYLHPEIVEKELEGIKTNTDRYEIFSMEDLRQELKCSVFNVLLAINAVYKLFKGTADSRQHFIKGIKRESINKLTTHWVAGFIISCINKQPVKELIDMYQTEEDTLSIILETCKAMNIQKHFYNEYKKIMGVSYTNRFNSSAAKKIKGVEGDNRVVDELRVIEIKQPAEKVEQIITFDTETSYVTDFQKVKLRDFQKEFLKKESENSLKLGVKENTETHSESFKNPLTNTSINTKELINKLEENFIKPDVIYITKEGFAEMQKYPLSETSSEVKKNPRKEAYIKGIYLGIVRELVKNTKELFASSFNNPSIISIVNTALGDVVISVILVEILPTIDFGARKEFVEKVVELLKLNTSVAIGEFATNMLIGIGKELAKENKIQDLVKQVVTV